MMDNLFLNLSILFGITVSIAVIIRFLRQPLMVAYLIAGIIGGPLFLNLMHGGEAFFHSFAEFGVVLLLFVVGLSLNINHIKKMGKVSFTTGIGQLLFTVLLGLPILLALGFSLRSSLYLAITVTFSSTIIVMKLLSDKKSLETVYGRYTLGLLIVQDLIAIAIMLFITSGDSSNGILPFVALLLLKGAFLLGAVYGLCKYILPLFLSRIASSGEFLFIFTIAWCFGVASLVYWAGFSIEMGAIIAGISLGSSPYHTEIASRIKPLRDFFIILFFIILGSELSLSDLYTAIVPSIYLALFIIIGNPLILYAIYRWNKFTRRNSFLAGLAAAQVSEFGFIMLFTGKQVGHLQGNELSVFTLTALMTIVISSYIITYNEQLYGFLTPVFSIFGKDKYQQPEETENTFDVFVVGYHRIGWKICEELKKEKIPFAVIDYNPEAVSRLKKNGIHAYFGDIADVEFLEELPLEKAKMVIMTVPEPEPQLTLIRYLNKKTKKVVLIGTLNHNKHLSDLYDAGADFVMMPHLLGGVWMSHLLREKPWTKKTFETLHKEQTKDMKQRFTAGTH